MAENIKVGVDISDNGTTKKLIKSVDVLHTTLQDTVKTASKISMGGTTGSRAVMAASAPSGSVAQYGQQRGAAGATGASARDFANQAQGLGGLVRLYATYAANVFAVGAAFRALSSAMDTTNMIRGMDQLGARSGMALGSISKQLVTVTDGAISLREAMSATAKVTAAGLGSETVVRLGKAAKNASQALGVDINDAVSRLSRGITKLEPELLDELGIFIRIDDVVQKYATSVGKSSSAITDFEKRTAVANAVLTQAEQKFGAIKLDANPYNQLAASIQNITQNILELTNKALGPLVNTLASSPTALIAALSSIALVLVKQALPALGEFKAGLQSAADKAQQISIDKGAAAVKARKAIDKQIENAVADSVDAQVSKVDAAEAKILALKKNGAEKSSVALRVLSKDLDDITEKDLRSVERKAKALEKAGSISEATAYREAAKAVVDVQAGEQALRDLRDENARKLQQDAKGMTTYGLTVQAARSAEIAATKSAIVSNAAYNGSLIGTAGAYRLLKAELDATDMSKFQKGMTLARGTTSAFFGQLGTFMNRLGMLGQAAGIAIGAFTLINSALSSNTKQSAALNTNLDALNSTVGSAAEVAKLYSSIDYTAGFSVDLIKATSTAVEELNTSIKNVVKSVKETDAAAGTWDRFIDGFLTVIGKDIKSTTSRGIAAAISSSIATAPVGPATEEYKKKLTSILSIKNFGKDSIIEALSNTRTPEEFKAKLDQLSGASAEFSKAQSIAAAKVIELDTAFADTNAAFLGLTNSFANTSPLQKFGIALQTESQKITAALEKPEEAFANLAKLSTDTKRITLFSPEVFNSIQQAAPQIEAINKAIVAAEQEVRDKQVQISEEKNQFTLSELKKLQARAEKTLADQKAKGKELTEGILTAIKTDNFITAGKIMGYEIASAGAQAALTIRKAYSGFLTGDAAIKENTKIAVAEIQNRTNLIQVTLDLIKSNYALQATNQKKAASDMLGSSTITPAQRTAAEKDYAKYSAQEAVFSSGNPAKEAAKYSADMVAELEPKLQSLQGMQKQIMQSGAEIAAQYIVQARELGAEAGKSLNTNLSNQKTTKQLYLDQLNLQEQLAGQSTESSILARQKVESEIRVLDQLTQETEVYGRLVGLAKVLSDPKLDRAKRAELETEVLKEQDKLLTSRAAATSKNTAAEFKDQKVLLDYRLQSLTTEAALTQNYANISDKAAQTRLEQQSQELQSTASIIQLRKELGVITAEEAIKDTANIQILQELNAAELTRANLKQQSGQTIAAAQTEIEKLEEISRVNGKLTKEQADQYFYQKELQRSTESNTAIALDGLNKQLAVRTSIITATAEQAIMQDRQNEALQKMAGLTETLANLFGELGSAIGNTGQALLKMANDDEAYLLKKGKLQAEAAKFNEGSDPAEVAKNYAAQQKLDKDKTKSELSNISSIAASSKKMFAEKTVAYKVLTGIEKAHSIMSAALQAKDLASTIATAIGKISGQIPAIYASFMSTLGPFGPPAAAAAIAAFIGGAFGGGGGGTPKFAATAEQQQAVQGTAQSYNSEGALVQTRSGVFGDVTAKSESIANSLKIIEENSVIGVEYDDKLLKAFRGLNVSLEATAKALYKSMNVSGGLFGTREGTTQKSGFLGISGLFSSSTTTSIVDAGVKLKGTFLELLNTGKDTAQFFETVSKTVTKSGFFGFGGSTRTTIDTALKGLDPKSQKAITSTFQNAADLLFEVGELAGVADSAITNAMSKISVDQLVSLKGLTGEAFTKELSAVIGSAMDDVAVAAFASFTPYQKFGEGMLETVTRVIDTNKSINQLLDNFESVTPNLTGLYAVTEVLADAAGGLDKFIAQANFFSDNFLTEAERLAPKQALVTKKMGELGFASVDTVAEFKLLVKSLDLTKAADAELYQSLMDLAPAFYDVATAASKALQETIDKFKSFAKTLKDFRDSLLLGTQSTLTPQQKYLEAQRQFETTYASALSGDVDAQGKLTGVATAFLDASKTYNASSQQYTSDFNSVMDKINSGIISAEATMTTAERQLTEAETQTDLLNKIKLASETTSALLTESLVGGKTIAQAVEDKIVQDEARIADAKVADLIASSGGSSTYQQGAKTGWDALTDAEKSAYYRENPTMSSITQFGQKVFGVTSLGMLQKLLDPAGVAKQEAIAAGRYYEGDTYTANPDGGYTYGSSSYNSFNQSIGISSESLGYTGADRGSYFAEGGLAPRGRHVVGELGPELVDFDTPGRVYTAQETFGMFNGNPTGMSENIRAVVQELQQVKRELVQLRAEQQRQTGDLITSNYDANQRAADKVSESIDDSMNSDWALRSQVAII